jgi:transposase
MVDKPAVDDGWRIPDELWERIEPLLPPKKPHPKGGRPWMPDRQVMDGIFYVLRTGCQWKALPKPIGAASTVHDRFQLWAEASVFRRMWEAGLLEYEVLKGIGWEWQAMDGAMTKAPLGGKRYGSQSHRSGQEWHEAKPADREPWDSTGGDRRRGEPARYEIGAEYVGRDGHSAPRADGGQAAASVYGQRV